jgi:transposase InsO family protein
VKYQFIAKHRDQFSITAMCRVLSVSRSGYYAWRNRPVSLRKMANDILLEQIKATHQKSRQTYGSPRIQAELVAQGIKCGRNRVARLMRLHGLSANQKRAFKVKTTDSNHDQPIAPNLLDQDFEADQPDQKWLTDTLAPAHSAGVTYIPTAQGWLYLAVVLDLYSRRIVGWAMSDSLERQLVINALQMALLARRPPPGLLHHSDRGSQYASEDYQALLTQHQLRCSMSRAGNCYDNAPMESFFGTLKTELVHHRHYATRAEARTDIFEFIEIFYNRFRRHSALAYQSPVMFEHLALAA